MTRCAVLSLLVAGALACSCPGSGTLAKYYDTLDWQNADFFWQCEPDGINKDWGFEGARIVKDQFTVIFQGKPSGDGELVIDCDDRVEVWAGQPLTGTLLKRTKGYAPYPETVQSGWKTQLSIVYQERYGAAHCRFRTATAGFDWVAWDAAGRDMTQLPVITSWAPPSAGQAACGSNAYQMVDPATLDPEKDLSYFKVAEIFEDEKQKLTATAYANGWNYEYAGTPDTSYVMPCDDFNLLANGLKNSIRHVEDEVVIKITMGDYTDYYRPQAGSTLCEMLQSNALHEWAPAETGPWYKVEGNRWLLGGTTDWWPAKYTFQDWRKYPSVWANANKGGCCYSEQTDDKWTKSYWERGNGESGQAFVMEAKYHPRTNTAFFAANEKPTIGDWDVYAQVNHHLNIKADKEGNTPYSLGWNLEYMTPSGHAQFIRKCEDYKDDGDAIVLKMSMGQKNYVGDWLGDVHAYFRPAAGKTLCDMLNSYNNHQFALSADGPWYTPRYHNKLYGGSAYDWEALKRDGPFEDWGVHHLPFWGGNRGAYGKYLLTESGNGNWGRSFQMCVKKQDRTDAVLTKTGSWKIPKDTWVDYMWELGAADEAVETNTKVSWKNPPLGQDYLTATEQGADPPGDETISGDAENAGSTLTWRRAHNDLFPTYWGLSGKDWTHFVKYWYLYFKVSNSDKDLKVTIRCDDACKGILDGAADPWFERTKYDGNKDISFNVEATGGWHGLLAKMWENGYTSRFAIKFDAEVETKWA